MYWAEALAAQSEDQVLADQFKPLFATLKANEQKIVDELNGVQGKPVDMGGYYLPDFEKTSCAMRPSATFNKALETLKA
jgi:isocitrate dehydrogenase